MMVAVNLGLAAANALLKKILDGGLNHLVIVAYRQIIATIFLAPIAYFWERWQLFSFCIFKQLSAT